MAARYAAGTRVNSDQSRAEVERTLQRYGATSFGYGWEERGEQTIVVVGFKIAGRQIKYVLPMPSRADFRYTPSRQWERSEKDQTAEWEKACRQRWRALALVIKAKLEAVASGITSLESEFLSATMLPSGETVGEWIEPQVGLAYQAGRMPSLLPGAARGALPAGSGAADG